MNDHKDHWVVIKVETPIFWEGMNTLEDPDAVVDQFTTYISDVINSSMNNIHDEINDEFHSWMKENHNTDTYEEEE